MCVIDLGVVRGLTATRTHLGLRRLIKIQHTSMRNLIHVFFYVCLLFTELQTPQTETQPKDTFSTHTACWLSLSVWDHHCVRLWVC